ncbi:threonine-phosphate decarboxylase [Rhodophyticola porphyridii]|uniref:Aminotransferase n=1 Tax=Rhodophyticola porphyridii TaxID=1852017 RepID=A0A3L9Y3Q7_9RHOB|nr:threonine-phosphate decarboxylase [Rhodophyticola porphyridii]RMA43434.1 pyridoxal phosphate-dependent class II aminotransferase [Rhodophyticola porphyridii]
MTGPAHTKRDHGGGIDAAARRFGGRRHEWLDLSTGINPVPYPVGDVPKAAWEALPDVRAMDALLTQARRFWGLPDGTDILAAPGASALIAHLPRLAPAAKVTINGPTYNEHEAAFRAAGWQLGRAGDAQVIVQPNNPDGRMLDAAEIPPRALTVIDESFCDVTPERTLIGLARRPGTLVLKSFGKFWGLAGLRLGFAIARPETLAQLAERLGPWPVSGPALHIAARALSDDAWAEETRRRLAADAVRMDALMAGAGATLAGGTSLFRLYDVADARAWQTRLARHRIWTRIFPYSSRWIRLGLPHPDHWQRLEAAIGDPGRP